MRQNVKNKLNCVVATAIAHRIQKRLHAAQTIPSFADVLGYQGLLSLPTDPPRVADGGPDATLASGCRGSSYGERLGEAERSLRWAE